MASALPLPHKASPLTNTIGLSKDFLQPDSRGPAMNGEALTGFYAEYRSPEEGDRPLSFHRLVALPCSLIRPPKNALFP